MSSITLKFKIPEEREEADEAVNAGKAWSCLHNIDNYCRSALKHDDGVSETTAVYLEKVRDIICEGGIHG
jgi:hypothetical protein